MMAEVMPFIEAYIAPWALLAVLFLIVRELRS